MADLAYEDALRKLGPALFLGEWIGKLTARDTWMLKDAYLSSTVVPGGLLYGGPLVRRAFERLEFMNWQREQAVDWLDANGIDVVERGRRSFVDKAKFERAFAREFGNVPAASPAKKKGGSRAYKDDAVVAEVRKLLKSGKARSMADAARRLLPRIQGAGTPEAKIERIRRKAANG